MSTVAAHTSASGGEPRAGLGATPEAAAGVLAGAAERGAVEAGLPEAETAAGSRWTGRLGWVGWVGRVGSHRVFDVLRGDGIKAAAARSSAWTVAAMFWTRGLRVVSNLILAHLLFPEAFGVMALMATVMSGLTMFSDVGIKPNLIRSHRGEDRTFRDTAFTLQFIRGLVLWAIATGLAWPLAHGFGHPDIALMLPVVGLTAVLQGLTPTKVALANRKLSLGRVTLIEMAGPTMVLVATVPLAAWLRSPWALVLGGVIASATVRTLQRRLLPGENDRFALDRECVRDQVRFGRWIFVSTAMTFLADQVDKFIFPAMFSMAAFGNYSIAVGLVMMITSLIKGLSMRVMLPVYADAARRDDRDLVSRRALAYQRRVGLPAVLLCAGLIALGGPLVDLLYPDTFDLAHGLLPVLALAGAFDVLRARFASLFGAFAKNGYGAVVSAVNLAVTATFCPLLGWAWGPLGFAAGMVLAAAAAYLLQQWYIARRLGIRRAGDAGPLCIILAATAVAAAAAEFLP